MCSPTRCRNCGKTTWSGCGQHVDQVMRNVPEGQQCTCTAEDEKGASAKGGGFLNRMLGR